MFKQSLRITITLRWVLAWILLLGLWAHSYYSWKAFEAALNACDEQITKERKPPYPELPAITISAAWLGQNRVFTLTSLHGEVCLECKFFPIGHTDDLRPDALPEYDRFGNDNMLGYRSIVDGHRWFFQLLGIESDGIYLPTQKWWYWSIPYRVFAVLLAIPTLWSAGRWLQRRRRVRRAKAFPVLIGAPSAPASPSAPATTV